MATIESYIYMYIEKVLLLKKKLTILPAEFADTFLLNRIHAWSMKTFLIICENNLTILRSFYEIPLQILGSFQENIV